MHYLPEYLRDSHVTICGRGAWTNFDDTAQIYQTITHFFMETMETK